MQQGREPQPCDDSARRDPRLRSLFTPLMDHYLTFEFTLHSAGVQESRCLFSIDMPLRWSGESRPGGRSYKGRGQGISIRIYYRLKISIARDLLWELYRLP